LKKGTDEKQKKQRKTIEQKTDLMVFSSTKEFGTYTGSKISSIPTEDESRETRSNGCFRKHSGVLNPLDEECIRILWD
jgi:hypothetical protein